MPRTRPPIVSVFVALSVLLPWLAACGERATEDPAPKLDANGAPLPPPPQPAVAILSQSIGPLAPVIEVLSERDPFVRAGRLAALLPTLGVDATASVARLVIDPAIDLSVTDVDLLVAFWARHDARAAAHWALFESPYGRKAGAIEASLVRLASDDPATAVQEVNSFLKTTGPFSEVAEIGLVRGWFASGKPGLVEYIRNLGVGFARQRALSAYSRALAQRDGAQAALDWAESIPADDEEWQKDVVRQTGWAVAMLDPVATSKWCDRLCPQRPTAFSLRAMIAQRYGSIDGPAAMEWVSRAPLDFEQNLAVKGVFNGWWGVDRPGFEKWLEAQAANGGIEPWLQPMLELYAASISWDSPERAIEWAGRIDADAETRERTLMNVARIWRRTDQAAADAWLDQSPLSEESREAVRNPQSAMPHRELTPDEIAEDQQDRAAKE